MDPVVFRTYRTHILSLYSARSADNLVPRLLTELRAIAKRLERNVGTDDVVNIQRLFRTLSVNILSLALYHKKLIDYLPWIDRYGSPTNLSTGH